jgi:hypothetical protein
MYRSTFSWPRHYLEMSGELHAPAALPPGKEHPVHIGEEVGWTPEPVWTTWRRENSWPYKDSKSDLLGRPARSQSLYRLHYPGSFTPCINKSNSDNSVCCLFLGKIKYVPIRSVTFLPASGYWSLNGLTVKLMSHFRLVPRFENTWNFESSHLHVFLVLCRNTE